MTRSALLAVAIADVIWPAPRLAAQGSDPPVPPLSPTDVACAPRVSSNPLQSEPRVIGPQDEFAKSHFAPSDTLVIDGGRFRRMDVDVDQEYFVRRRVAHRHYRQRMLPILHTAGWVRIVEGDDAVSLTTVGYACEAIQAADYLEPAVWEPVVVPAPDGDPDLVNPGVILFGLDGRSFITTNEYFVFGLETIPEIVAGQRVNVFRKGDTRHEGVATAGETVVVHIDHETTSATARLLTTPGAVEAGDHIALHQ